MPIVVMDASSYASYSNIARGITYAADRGVRIISISITGTTSSATLQSAVNYAWNKNAVVFAAAGNANTTALGYPAACDKVIAVGATDSADLRASYSNYGSWIELWLLETISLRRCVAEDIEPRPELPSRPRSRQGSAH